MTEVLFNFHDVILWMTAMQCLFFAVLLLATNNRHITSTYFLAAFLLAHVFIPLHELILWGAVFKLKIRDIWPELYFIGGYAYFLDGPLLYFCIKSLVFRDFTLRKRDALHLLPLLLFAGFMWLVFYRLPEAQRLAMITSEEFVYGGYYVFAEFLCKLLRLGYAILCLILIIKYKSRLKSVHSNIERGDVTWVTTLVIGFLIVMLMEVTLSAAKAISLKLNFELIVFEYIGLTSYYSMFILVNLLVFTSIRYFSSFYPVSQKDGAKKTINENLLNPEVAREIDQAMQQRKPYLQPDITLDQLATELDVPAKDLSMIINRHFGVNFYEFVNRYRVDEAKHLLLAESHHDKTITDIFIEVGFNSKSVFNTFFKKMVGATPSQYRQNAKAG